jgi:hypothetical protein
MSYPKTAPDNSLTELPSRLRLLWPAYCALAVFTTFGYALYDPYQIDGDAVAYMDIGDLIRAHEWHAVINGYWNPLYPFLLAVGRVIFRATRYTELHAYYMVNFGIFLLGMLAIITFTDALSRLRDSSASGTRSFTAASFLLDRYTLRYLGIGLFLISTQRELSIGKIRPDALLQALLLFSAALLLRYLATERLRFAALMGLWLGLAYLAKSFAFPFMFLCIVVLGFAGIFLKQHRPQRIAAACLLTLLCFSVVSGPYIAALSHQKHRFDFGDSGNLNYAWLISGTARMHLQRDSFSRFGTADVYLLHPEEQLLQAPGIFSYKRLPYGTYPGWFDPSFWNERIRPHMNAHMQIVVIGGCLLHLLRCLSDHPEPWLLLAVLFFLGARLGPRHSSPSVYWLPPILLGLSIIAIYGIVHIEDRYIAIGILLILLPIYAALRSSTENVSASYAASAMILLLAILPLGESLRQVGELRRELVKKKSAAGWHDRETFDASLALSALGVAPGDTVACIGNRACVLDQYWARLAGVRILTEIYEPTLPLDPLFASMPNHDQAIDIVRHEGAKVLVGYFTPGLMNTSNRLASGWIELGTTPYYALPLNLSNSTLGTNHRP